MDISTDVARIILEQEITTLKNTRYQLEVRHRVNKKVGTADSDLKVIVEQLEKIEKLIEGFEEELKALN
jgi:phage shock protein A